MIDARAMISDLISRQAASVELSTMLKECFSVDDEIIDAVHTTLQEIRPAQQWIPVKYRPMTEEEKEYWSECLVYELDDNSMFDCQMPDDGQKILVCSKCGNIWIDTHEDDGGLMGLEENGDWEGIVAWMTLPEPYKDGVNDE